MNQSIPIHYYHPMRGNPMGRVSENTPFHYMDGFSPHSMQFQRPALSNNNNSQEPSFPVQMNHQPQNVAESGRGSRPRSNPTGESDTTTEGENDEEEEDEETDGESDDCTTTEEDEADKGYIEENNTHKIAGPHARSIGTLASKVKHIGEALGFVQSPIPPSDPPSAAEAVTGPKETSGPCTHWALVAVIMGTIVVVVVLATLKTTTIQPRLDFIGYLTLSLFVFVVALIPIPKQQRCFGIQEENNTTTRLSFEVWPLVLVILLWFTYGVIIDKGVCWGPAKVSGTHVAWPPEHAHKQYNLFDENGQLAVRIPDSMNGGGGDAVDSDIVFNFVAILCVIANYSSIVYKSHTRTRAFTVVFVVSVFLSAFKDSIIIEMELWLAIFKVLLFFSLYSTCSMAIVGTHALECAKEAKGVRKKFDDIERNQQNQRSPQSAYFSTERLVVMSGWVLFSWRYLLILGLFQNVVMIVHVVSNAMSPANSSNPSSVASMLRRKARKMRKKSVVVHASRKPPSSFSGPSHPHQNSTPSHGGTNNPPSPGKPQHPSPSAIKESTKIIESFRDYIQQPLYVPSPSFYYYQNNNNSTRGGIPWHETVGNQKPVSTNAPSEQRGFSCCAITGVPLSTQQYPWEDILPISTATLHPPVAAMATTSTGPKQARVNPQETTVTPPPKHPKDTAAVTTESIPPNIIQKNKQHTTTTTRDDGSGGEASRPRPTVTTGDTKPTSNRNKDLDGNPPTSTEVPVAPLVFIDTIPGTKRKDQDKKKRRKKKPGGKHASFMSNLDGE